MGRAPCCDKANVKKGPWSPEEDAKLKAYIEQQGTGGNWIALPQKIGLKRCGKSCRLRWLNYLRPNIKHGGFSEEEDNIICSLYLSIGSRWSIIAAQLPGRTDNDIKNYWNTRLKKKLLGKQRKEQAAQARRANNLKQEMKRETDQGLDQYFPSGFINQAPYWPEIPVAVPVMNQNYDSHLKDQASIKNFLIKLGGRFSETTTSAVDFQYPIVHEQAYEASFNIVASSAQGCSFSQLPNTQYEAEVPPGSAMLQGLDNLQAELSELIYSNPQQLDGLEDLLGMEMVIGSSNGTTTSTSVESGSWGEMNSSSLTYNPPIASYQKGMAAQDSGFEEYSSYFGQNINGNVNACGL
ncbi:hypothetical protein UlMin_038393 [Ulmus minor]